MPVLYYKIHFSKSNIGDVEICRTILIVVKMLVRYNLIGAT